MADAERGSDTTVGASGATLSLSSATVNGPGTLTNQGTLTLLNYTINAALTNQGTVKAFNTTVSAGLSNAGTLTVEPGASLTLNGTSNNTSTGTIDVWANDGAGNLGYSTLTVGGAMTNAGTIELRSDATNGYYATLNLSSATLANSGLIHSTLAGTGTASSTNFINLFGTGSVLTNTGTVQVDQPLTSNINSDQQFDTSGGTLQVAGGQVLQFSGGGTVVVGATSFGTGAGTVAVNGGTLNVASDTTVGGSGATLSLSSATVNRAGHADQPGRVHTAQCPSTSAPTRAP